MVSGAGTITSSLWLRKVKCWFCGLKILYFILWYEQGRKLYSITVSDAGSRKSKLKTSKFEASFKFHVLSTESNPGQLTIFEILS